MDELPPLTEDQKEAIDFVFSNWKRNPDRLNSLCALDIGMGKTRLACEIINILQCRDNDAYLTGYTLVCCPTIELINTIWTETLSLYNKKPLVLRDEELGIRKLPTKKALTIPNGSVCLITYSNLCNSENIEYIKNTPPSLIVFDEFHTLTNNTQNREKEYRNAICKLPFQQRIGLTATPLVNDEMESVIAYGLLNDPPCIERFYGNPENERKELKSKIKNIPFYLIKENRNDTVISSEWFISIPMGRRLYDQYTVLCGEYKNRMTRVHQVGKLSVSSGLIDKKTRSRLKLDAVVETGKITALRLIVLKIPKIDKLVVFDNQKPTLNYLARLDFMKELNPVSYYGGDAKNSGNISTFINDPGCRLLLATRQAGGEGMNLQAANHIVIMNCWYTVKDIIQMIGRIKRTGQTKPVFAYILGYNLFGCIDPGQPKNKYLLPEDFNFLKAILRKSKMSREWGIKSIVAIPQVRCFVDFENFERDFSLFLGNAEEIRRLPDKSIRFIQDDFEELYDIQEDDVRLLPSGTGKSHAVDKYDNIDRNIKVIRKTDGNTPSQRRDEIPRLNTDVTAVVVEKKKRLPDSSS